MAVNALGNSSDFDKIQNNKRSAIDRITKKIQPRIDKVTLKHEEAIEQSSALDTLSKLVGNFTGAAAVLQKPYDSPFENKNATLTTTDLGLPEKYVSVIPGKYTPKMTFDLRVEQVATASKLLIDCKINSDKAVDSNGSLDFEINGSNVTINFTSEETGQDIVKKINSEFEKEGVKARANLLKLGNDTANIQVTHQELGEKSMKCAFVKDKSLQFGPVIEYDGTGGTSAKIVIDGTELVNKNSNIFDGKTIGFEGVTIKALAPNTPAGDAPTTKQTVTIAPDTTNDGVMMKSISKFARAYNDLKIFVAKMTEKSSDKEYAQTAILHNSSAIRQAQALLGSVFDPNINNGGKYKSLSDVGVGLVPADKDEAAPIGTTLLQTVDEAALRNALENNYEDFTALFRGALKVTENRTNQGSKLSLSLMSKSLDSKFYNQDMTVKINPGANPGEIVQFTDPDDGSQYDVEANFGGKIIKGNYKQVDSKDGNNNAGYIDFNGTPLEGLRLYWNAVKANNETNSDPEVFTVNLSQGLADITYFRSNDLMGEDGKGSLEFISTESQSKVKSFSKKKTELETILARDLEKIEQAYSKVEEMSLLNDIILEGIKGLLNPES